MCEDEGVLDQLIVLLAPFGADLRGLAVDRAINALLDTDQEVLARLDRIAAGRDRAARPDREGLRAAPDRRPPTSPGGTVPARAPASRAIRRSGASPPDELAPRRADLELRLSRGTAIDAHGIPARRVPRRDRRQRAGRRAPAGPGAGYARRARAGSADPALASQMAPRDLDGLPSPACWRRTPPGVPRGSRVGPGFERTSGDRLAAVPPPPGNRSRPANPDPGGTLVPGHQPA